MKKKFVPRESLDLRKMLKPAVRTLKPSVIMDLTDDIVETIDLSNDDTEIEKIVSSTVLTLYTPFDASAFLLSQILPISSSTSALIPKKGSSSSIQVAPSSKKKTKKDTSIQSVQAASLPTSKAVPAMSKAKSAIFPCTELDENVYWTKGWFTDDVQKKISQFFTGKDSSSSALSSSSSALSSSSSALSSSSSALSSSSSSALSSSSSALSSSSSALSSSADTPLPQGVILVRNFLNIDDQNRVVKEADTFHERAPFYIKKYGSGSLHFYLTTFGLHWTRSNNKKNGAYSLTRTDCDKLPCPPMPPFLASLAARAFGKDAPREVQNAVDCGDIPYCSTYSMGHFNFYPEGKLNGATVELGSHQDDAESDESVAAQLPVFSLSIGNSADFALKPTREEWGRNLEAHLALSGIKIEESSSGSDLSENLECTIRLNSGDLLIFGGCCRLIRHGISKFYACSKPAELVMRGGRLNCTLRCDPWSVETVKGGEKGKKEKEELLKLLKETPPWRKEKKEAKVSVGQKRKR